MQPHEFYDMLKGYQWRQEQQENTLAFFVCHLMNISGKSLKWDMTPQELLKPLRRHQVKQNRAEDEAALREQFGDRLLGGGKIGDNR